LICVNGSIWGSLMSEAQLASTKDQLKRTELVDLPLGLGAATLGDSRLCSIADRNKVMERFERGNR
jgi:hypothetical protein